MRLWSVFAAGLAAVVTLAGQDFTSEAWKLEAKGEAVEARDQLQKAAEAAPNNPLALEAYAEFLDRHRDPDARKAYANLDQLLSRNGASMPERAKVARRLVILDMIAADRPAALRHLEEYRAAGGSGFNLPAASLPSSTQGFIEIPGPLRSFSRMAALSPELDSQDLLSSLAHNITINGYQATRANETLEPTEYLKLIVRYLSQARELERLSGPEKVLHIDMCEAAQTGDLLRILGYRMRGGCGSDVVLETVNASRAFLTIDSGFPLSELEEALRTNRPFTLDYHPARVPVLFGPEYWQQTQKPSDKQTEFLDFFISDPGLCRLYLALNALDPETVEQLRKDQSAQKLKIYAHVLDFFGAMFELKGGKALVPGGARSEKAWTDLVTVSPEKGSAFFEKLIEKDDGWMASYYDALARINGPVQDYLSDPERLKRFYTAIRGRVTSPGPARPVFRANTDLLLLTTRLRLDPNGKPHLPGGMDVWKNLFAGKLISKYDPKLAKAAPGWKDSEEVVEGLFGLCRKTADNEPLKIFMALTDVERNRAKPLETATVDRLVADYRLLGSQYPLFSEAPSVSDATILAFLDAAHGISQIKDAGFRSDAAGVMQSLAGIWQIFVRQGNIADTEADAALAAVIQPFAKIQGQRDIFEGGQKGVRVLVQAAHAPAGGLLQDHMMDLLAGTKATGDTGLSDAHQQMLQDMTRVFEAQRLVSLDSLFNLADRLEAAAGGQKLDMQQTAKLAAGITEIQLPRTALTVRERTEMAAGYWTDRHIDAERKLNLRAAIDKAGADPQKLRDVRAALTPILRDTLVGLNYIHYAPPGAQVLYTNPAFVRSHDFAGTPDRPRTWSNTEVFGSGWPANAGGRLVGSLISLPYALAECEQNFLIPSREQALIWGDLVPQMILSAVIPRWWTVTPTQLHWVGLHMAYADTVLAESALNEAERQKAIAALNHYVPPARLKKIERLLASGEVRAAAENVVPSEMYLLAHDLAPGDVDSPIAQEIRHVAQESPEGISPRAISHAFGTPKPMLANSYRPELLNLRTFPTLMGYSSRILAESWESNLLYYGALADEMHIRPAELNVLVPAWTQQTVERIFATHLEDWPALLRSLRMVGDDVRQKAHKQIVANN